MNRARRAWLESQYYCFQEAELSLGQTCGKAEIRDAPGAGRAPGFAEAALQGAALGLEICFSFNSQSVIQRVLLNRALVLLVFPLHSPTAFYPGSDEGLGCCHRGGGWGDASSTPVADGVYSGGGSGGGLLRERAAYLRRNRARSLTSGGDASGVYLTADKIFISKALGKQMSAAEIQIVFANGNAVAKERRNRYLLGGKFLSSM